MDSTLPVSEVLELSTYFVAPLSMGIHVIFFLFLSENIRRGYSLEVPCPGASNEYPQHIFGEEIRKISVLFV